MSFRPFADEAVALRIGGLTGENRLDRVSLWGNLDLTRDRAGLRLIMPSAASGQT
jgi:hypothetical protein